MFVKRAFDLGNIPKLYQEQKMRVGNDRLFV